MLVSEKIKLLAHTARDDAVVLDLGRTLEAKVLSPPSLLRNLSVSLGTGPIIKSPHAVFPSPRNIIIFLVFAKPSEARLLHLLFLVFDFTKKAVFIFSLKVCC